MKNISNGHFWVALAAVLAAAGLCIQVGAAPWPSFYGEWIFSIIFALVAVAALAKYQEPFRISITPVALLLVLAAALLTQIKSQSSLFFGAYALNAIYVCGFGLVFLLTSSQGGAQKTIINFVFGYFIAAGFLSLTVQLLQLSGFYLNLLPYQAWRLSATLGQPNVLATFFIMAIAATIYFWEFLNKKVGIIVISGFIFGICLAQSRSGIFNLILGSFLFFLFHQKNMRNFMLVMGFVVCAWFLSFFLLQANVALNPINSVQNLGYGAGRLEIWGMGIKAITQKPWLGYGLGNISFIQYEGLSFLPGRAVLAYSHNIFIDLILWFGLLFSIPITLLLTYVLLMSFKESMEDRKRTAVLLAAPAVIFHALFEAPHSYAYLLFPLAVFLGSCASLIHSKWSFKVKAQILIVPILIAFLLLLMIFQDYRKIQKGIDASVVYSQGAPVKKNDLMPTSFFLMDQWEYFFYKFYQPANTDIAQAGKLQQLAALIPTTALDIKVIYLFQENGLGGQAMRRLMKACSMEAQEECDRLKANPLIQKTVMARQAYCAAKPPLNPSNFVLTDSNTPVAACY